MSPRIIGQAIGLFAATNLDDLLVLSLFFAHGAGHRHSALRIVVGQYLGFIAILAVALTASAGAALLPEKAIPCLGLLPLALGLRAAWQTWLDHRGDEITEPASGQNGTSPSPWEVASVTFANEGDNIGAYVPVFATRPVIAKTLDRWGRVLLPVVLMALGLLILIRGRAFGL